MTEGFETMADESEPDLENESGTLSRRKLLISGLVAGGGLTGVAAVGSQLLTSDGETAQAPADYPTISTRGHFDTPQFGAIERVSGISKTDYDTTGDWSTIRAADTSEITVFVHGLNVSAHTNEDIKQAYTSQIALEQNGYDGHVVAFSWPSDTGIWWDAKEFATRVAPKLANWTRVYLQNFEGTVRYVAHSLGARVALRALSLLDQWTPQQSARVRVTSTSILGGAIPSIAPAQERHHIEEACGRFDNFYKQNDWILYAISLIEGELLGRSGLPPDETPPVNYTDHDVTDRVPDHDLYFHPDTGCMDRVAETF